MDLEVRMTLKVQNDNLIVFVILKLVGIDPSCVFIAHPDQEIWQWPFFKMANGGHLEFEGQDDP